MLGMLELFSVARIMEWLNNYLLIMSQSVEVEREAVEKRGGFGTEPPEPRVKVMLPLNIPLTIPLTRALLVSKPWRNILLVNLVVVGHHCP